MGRILNIITNFLKIAKKRGKVISSTIDIERKQGVLGRKRGNKMKKINLIILVMTLFSFVAGSLSGLKQVHAETTKTELIDENYLKVDYDYKKKDDSNEWRIRFKRQSEDKNFDQRLKLKITDEKDKTIEYPVVDNMKQKDEWLIEENFTQTMEGQVTLNLSKSVEKLQLYVQLDQKEAGKEDAKVHEDMLDREKPFELKIKKDKDDKKEDVEKKDEAKTIGSEEFIGPKKLQQMKAEDNQAILNRANLLATTSTKYKIKEPQYTPQYTPDPVTGQYPTNYWTIAGQNNVRNHRGGNDNSSGWDNTASWSSSADNYRDSYINYGVGQRTDISLRKYATETSNPEEFKLRLNVRGNSITKPGVDIFFVLDNSSSMGYLDPPYNIGGKKRKTLAISALNNLLGKFEDNLPANSDYMRIGGIVYGDGVGQPYNLSKEPADWKKMVKGYESASTADQNTFTQGGLVEAQKKLQESGNDRRKILFLLTDGAPNLSLKPTAGRVDKSMYFDSVRITQYDQSTTAGRDLGACNYTVFYNNGYYTPPFPQKYFHQDITNINGGSNLEINSHLTMAVNEAQNVKEKGIELQTIAIGILRRDNNEHEEGILRKGLYKMASQRTGTTGNSEKDHYFYHITKEEEFGPSFDDWYDSVLSTVENGIIEDPLGDMVELVTTPDSKKPTVKDVSTKNGLGAKAIENGKKPIIDYSNPKKIKVSNINLFGNQEIQIDYTVRLKTESADFISNKWYLANGTDTILQPTPDRTKDKLKFGVPSVKANSEDFRIPVEKVWDDKVNNQENYWGVRNSNAKVMVELQKKNRTGGYFEKAQGPVELSKVKNNWQHTFTPVEGRSAEYRIKEVSRTYGYGIPENIPKTFTQLTLNGTAKVTNKLLTGNTYFFKYKEDGKTAFTGAEKDLPQFELTNEKGKKYPGKLIPNTSNGRVDIINIPVGEYTLKETNTPSGYAPMKDIKIKVEENSAKTGVVATFPDGSPYGYKITNELKRDIPIKVEKVWEDKHDGTENYWGMRSDSVEFEVLEKIGNQQKYEPLNPPIKLTLNQANKWQATFYTYDEDKIYRLREVNRAPGYQTPYDVEHEFAYKTVKNGAARIRNTLLKGTYSFYKYMDDGKTPFTGNDLPEFTVKRKDGRVLIKGLKPKENGEVPITDIPVGDFVVTESHVPKGFAPMEDFNLKVTEKIDRYDHFNKPVYIAEVKSDLGSSPAINKLKPFDLTINKVNQDGDPLKGAKFKLTKPDGTSETLSGEGPTFTRNDLKAGDYTLEEIKVPDGHKGMETTLRFTIEKDGKVTIPTHPNVESKYKLEEGDKPNTITLTISNKRVLPGVFPRTGGGTARTMFKIAFALSGIAGLLGGAYWLYSRKG